MRGRGPNAVVARRKYDEMAPGYDRQLAPLRRVQDGLRRRAVAALELTPGDSVLDVGCGTGASFPLLVEAVGPTGRVIGVDQSDGMLGVAIRRIAERGWPNVEVISAPVQDAELPAIGAALFFFTHDLLRTPAALDNVASAVGAGGRIVATGARRPPWWLAPLALPAWLVMRRYVTTSEGLARPWDLLAPRLDRPKVEGLLLGSTYLVAGNTVASGAA